jgi:16S rRNA (adenine1518-N6/adenine1519-N6)-dimethyltransferase
MAQGPAALAPKKSLGQHFLHDDGVLGRIAELSSPEPGSGCVEIGPGTGNLTDHLLRHMQADQRLVALDLDRRVPEILQQRFGDRVELRLQDAADCNWAELLRSLGPRPTVVGNLPYYAALPILFAVLESEVPAARLVLMVQKEVADRLVNAPGSSDTGQVTVKLQMRADAKMAFKVGKGAFQPPPNVESAVIVVSPLPATRYPLPDWGRFSRLVTAGFGQRRKTLANAVQAGLGVPGEAIRQALRECGLDDRMRAEALTLKQWAALAHQLDPVLKAK